MTSSVSPHEAPLRALIAIKGEPLVADPDMCRFALDRPVHPGGPFFYKSREAAAGSPLPERLFEIDGVTSVLVAGTVVTVGKVAERSWSAMMRPIGQAIRTLLLSGVPAILESQSHQRNEPRNDAQIREDVDAILQSDINPSVASHGGKISVVDVKDGIVYLSMSGGCQGCAAASVTLRQGVEVMIRRQVREVVSIVDTTAHTSGEKPFYRAES
jgi:NFU1 iron-sulfur cluster scaffold homolog, mitochondrial